MAIDITNYESYFLQYADGELNTDDRELVEAFVAGHPSLKAEMDGMEGLRLVPDERIVFPDHALLLKPEKERRAVVLFWYRAAAVLVLLLATALYLWLPRAGEPRHRTATSEIVKSQVLSRPVSPTQHSSATGKNGASLTAVVTTSKPSAGNKQKHSATTALPFHSNMIKKEVASGPREGSLVSTGDIAVANHALPAIEKRGSIEPVINPTAGILQSKNMSITLPEKQSAVFTADPESNTDNAESGDAISVFANGKKNKIIGGLLRRVSRITHLNNATASVNNAPLRVSIIQINLK